MAAPEGAALRDQAVPPWCTWGCGAWRTAWPPSTRYGRGGTRGAGKAGPGGRGCPGASCTPASDGAVAGTARFALLAGSGAAFAVQKLVNKKLPYPLQWNLLLSVAAGSLASYTVTRAETQKCSDFWIYLETGKSPQEHVVADRVPQPAGRRESDTIREEEQVRGHRGVARNTVCCAHVLLLLPSPLLSVWCAPAAWEMSAALLGAQMSPQRSVC
ncbi:transmembrane protein 141 isoform X2 [Numida meleagris]|uniref:transmembrane protein 141 isoform X2 n=1 Tax=Numida meleagris TaxID=8996 RepID=UPI000B3DDE86|nr:transmembrane protein 141 isoform X2 [Numida meleagris]